MRRIATQVSRSKVKTKAAMAQVIEFYIPARFHRKVKWVPSEQRGKVIEFPSQRRRRGRALPARKARTFSASCANCS
jgi:hypothetical protein